MEWTTYLRDKVAGPVLHSAGHMYPGVATAIACLDWLEAQGYEVLGFDGLNSDGRYIRPDLGFIADLSGIDGEPRDRVARSIHEARQILSEFDGRVQFVDMTVRRAT